MSRSEDAAFEELTNSLTVDQSSAVADAWFQEAPQRISAMHGMSLYQRMCEVCGQEKPVYQQWEIRRDEFDNGHTAPATRSQPARRRPPAGAAAGKDGDSVARNTPRVERLYVFAVAGSAAQAETTIRQRLQGFLPSEDTRRLC